MNDFCQALGCTRSAANDHTPFCMIHWIRLSFKTQRAVREHDPNGVAKAKTELIR